jgi:hypothetical protein
MFCLIHLNGVLEFKYVSSPGVSISALWPATGIRSHVTEVLGAPDKLMREPTIFADAVLQIAEETSDRYVQ